MRSFSVNKNAICSLVSKICRRSISNFIKTLKVKKGHHFQWLPLLSCFPIVKTLLVFPVRFVLTLTFFRFKSLFNLTQSTIRLYPVIFRFISFTFGTNIIRQILIGFQ